MAGAAAELRWDPNDPISLASPTATTLANMGTLGAVGCTSGTRANTIWTTTPSGVGVLSFNGTNSALNLGAHDFGAVIAASGWIAPRPKASINTLFAYGGSGINNNGSRPCWSASQSATRSVSLETASGGVGNEQRTADGVVTDDRWQMLTDVIDTAALTVAIYLNGDAVPVAVMAGTRGPR